MWAAILNRPGEPLEIVDIPCPSPGPGQVQIAIAACAVCRTDLHVVDGDLGNPTLPIIPGHEIVGRVVAIGDGVDGLARGDRVGVAWLGGTCGRCRYCQMGDENLCDDPAFTGFTQHGGFAEQTVANAEYCFSIPADYSDIEAAPLLCAGLIGYRSLAMIGRQVQHLGILGFGAAAHIVAQVAHQRGVRVYAYTRPGDRAAQRFALEVGATWSGGSDEAAPVELDAAIIFAPVGPLVPRALKAVRKGGVVVCGGIHMSNIPSFPYDLLWGERCVKSVANLTRRDAVEFLELAPRIPIKSSVQTYPLSAANAALADLRDGRLSGAAVLEMRHS